MHDPSAPSPPTPDFKDRSARLTVFGILSILAGCASGLLGLLHLLLLAIGGGPAGSMPVDARTAVTGALLYGLLGAAFVWVGAGSMRRRRWVRPMMLTLAWTWLLGGVGALLLLPALVDATLASAAGGASLDPTLRSVALLILVGFGTFAGVVLPALFIWTYNDRNLRLTCEAHDPTPDWTERCPPSVLGMSVGLAACAVLGLVLVLRPAVPLFGRMWTGWPGALAMVAGSALCLWLARELYALRPRGWWATTAFLVLLGISTWWTLQATEPSELFRAIGWPADSPPPSESFLSISSWLTVVVTLLTVVYMAAIRRHFSGESSDSWRAVRRTDPRTDPPA